MDIYDAMYIGTMHIHIILSTTYILPYLAIKKCANYPTN